MDIQKLKRITVVYFGNTVLFVGGKNKYIVLLYVVDAAGRGVFSAAGFEQHYLELQMPMLQNRTVKRLNSVVPQLEQNFSFGSSFIASRRSLSSIKSASCGASSGSNLPG